AARAASRFVLRDPENEDISLREAPRYARAPRNHDGRVARTAGGCPRSAHGFARARPSAPRVLPQRAGPWAAEDGHRARARAARRCEAVGAERDGSAQALANPAFEHL